MTFAATFALGFASAAWTLVCNAGRCPSVDVIKDYEPRQTSKLFAADGSFIAELGLEHRTLVPLDDIPRTVRDAFVITEDKRFYQHHGIDWSRVAGAAARNIVARSYAQGFSTITMQLARNIFSESITREKTLVRKLKEAKVARAIEARYPKDKILELYLNQIYLGDGAYGVETAAQRYFGKSVRDLNLAEAATLAGLPKSTRRYNPKLYPDRAVARRNTVIDLMRREGVISDAEASAAEAYPLQLVPRREAGEVAPYFVEWVREQLDAQFGQQLYEQGLHVYTTLDPEMQAAAERALEGQLRAIEGGQYGKFTHVTYEAYVARSALGEPTGGPTSPYLQGCLIALDPRTGAVRALVGGRDFDDSKFDRCTQALRQPGSAFKPIVYADAIESGLPPSYMVADTPLVVPQIDGSKWMPKDDDGRFLGMITLRRGLYDSRNLAAVRLGMQLGPASVIAEARKFGITTPIHPYPSIYIGSESVYPIELVAAYTAFANLGDRTTPLAVTRVETADGQVLWEPPVVRIPVLSPEEAWEMVSMLKDVILRGTAFTAVDQAGFHIPAAGKTGTTNDGNDVWFIGFTADLVAGVWLGMDLPAKIKVNALGGVLAAPAWTAFMTDVYRRKPEPPDWPRPPDLIGREIDGTTGLLASASCPSSATYTEWFIPGTEPVGSCGDAASGIGVFPPRGTAPVAPVPPAPAPPAPAPPLPHRPAGVPATRVRHDTTIANPFKLP